MEELLSYNIFITDWQDLYYVPEEYQKNHHLRKVYSKNCWFTEEFFFLNYVTFETSMQYITLHFKLYHPTEVNSKRSVTLCKMYNLRTSR